MNKRTLACLCITLLAAQPSFAQEKGNPADPYEPYNRVMYKINDTADHYVLTPVARGYRKITPSPVRAGVSNFFNNLRDVVSLGSNVLRLDIKRASEDFVRVGVNSTFGLAGLINIADAGGIPNNKNTLGDTFASWGWKNSHYFVYPLTGPSTLRDSIGQSITTVYSPTRAVLPTSSERWTATGLNAINTREQYLDLTDGLDQAAVDKYAYTRDMYMSMRAKQLGIQPPQTAADQDIDIDDLVSSDSDHGDTSSTTALTPTVTTPISEPSNAANSAPTAAEQPIMPTRVSPPAAPTTEQPATLNSTPASE